MLIQLERRRGASATAGVVSPSVSIAPRVRVATIADMDHVEPIIAGFARRGLMLPKTREQLYRTFREFVVADVEGQVLGCAALRVYTPELAEVCALAVSEAAHGRGVGRGLVEELVEQARTLGIRTLFALTLEDGFFHRLGFRTTTVDEFPLKVASDCRTCPRRSHCPEITVARDLDYLDERSVSDA